MLCEQKPQFEQRAELWKVKSSHTFSLSESEQYKEQNVLQSMVLENLRR